MFLFQEPEIAAQVESSWDKLSDKLTHWSDAIVLVLPNFVLAAIIFIIFLMIAKYSGGPFDALLKRSIKKPAIRVITNKIIKIIIVLIGFFIALMVMDFNTILASILGAAGVMGLAIGLALQGTLSNTFSGVILSFLPKLRIGDWVETNGYAGFVTDINLRCIVLKPSNNNLVMIPNTKVIDEPFANLSQTQRSRIMITCGVGYESDLEFVEKLVKKTIASHYEPQGNEEVELFYQEFGGSSINFLLRFWTDCVNSKDEYTAEHTAIKLIKKAFDENGINIPFPIQTLDFAKNKFRSEPLRVESVPATSGNSTK